MLPPRLADHLDAPKISVLHQQERSHPQRRKNLFLTNVGDVAVPVTTEPTALSPSDWGESYIHRKLPFG
ncbi:unnamed protein product [Brassica oleracea]